MTYLYWLQGFFPRHASPCMLRCMGSLKQGLCLNVFSRRAIYLWFWQDALQRSRPDFISRSQGRVRELERKAQERRKLPNSVGPQLEKAPRQRRALSTGSTSLNGNALAASLTSCLQCAVHCFCAAAVAFCHTTNHTRIQIQTKKGGKGVFVSQCCFSEFVKIFLF